MTTSPTQDSDYYERVQSFLESNTSNNALAGIIGIGGQQFQNADYQTVSE